MSNIQSQTVDQLNKQIETQIQLAINALEKEEYKKYIHHLDILGNLTEVTYRKEKNDDSPRNKVFTRQKVPEWLQQKFEIKDKLALSESGYLAYCITQEAWIDEYLKKPILVNGQKNYRRSLSPKFPLAMSTRHNINLGMRTVALAIKSKDLPLSNITQERIITLDKKIYKAIGSYRTTKQSVLHVSSITIAVIMTLVCSLLTAGAVALTVAAWPVAAVGVIAAVIFAASLAINWLTYRRVIPRLLNNIFGKDKLFEGITNYRDPETGDKKIMTRRQKIALGISFFVSSILGAATGAVTSGFILGLGKLSILPFLAAGTAGAACLPPLGIAIAIVFCFSSIILLMRPLINIIKAKNFKSMLLQPFKYTAAIFDPHNKKNLGKKLIQLKIEKAITYGILGMLSVFTFFGLVILQIQNGAALSNFLNNTLAIGSAIAVGVSYFISLLSVLIGQLPYALNNVAEVVVAVIAGFQNIFMHNTVNQNQPSQDPSPSSFVKTKNGVTGRINLIGGIKQTVNEILPTAKIKSEGKSQRLNNVINILITPSEPRAVKSFREERKLNERYCEYFFIFKKPEKSAGNSEKTVQFKSSPKTNCLKT